MNLAMLGTSITNVFLRTQNMLLTSGLTVESVLEANEDAMNSGGELADATDKVTGTVAGGYHLVFNVTVLLGVIAIMLGGAMLLFSNSSKREEVKSGLVWKFIGIVLIVAAVPILIFAESIAKGILG